MAEKKKHVAKKEAKKPKHEEKKAVKHAHKPKHVEKKAAEHVQKHEEKKAGVKDKKADKKPVKAEKSEKKAENAGKKPVKKPKKEAKKVVKISKSKAVKKLSALVQAKKRRMFRGRFGSRSVRKVSKEKWQKWRKPRGIDIYFKKEDGLVPGSGYGTPRKIRFLHPSGYKEAYVKNMQDLLNLEKDKESTAARISAKIGKKKKIDMLKKADELKIVVLNR